MFDEITSWILIGTSAVALIVAVVVLCRKIWKYKGTAWQLWKDLKNAEIRDDVYNIVIACQSDTSLSNEQKLDKALTEIDKLCETKNVEFDKDQWTEIVNSTVSNFNSFRDICTSISKKVIGK